MPYTTLGENYNWSMRAFQSLVTTEPERIPFLKQSVETAPGRFQDRIFKDLRIKTTDYNRIWDELAIFHFATIGFVVDAADPFVQAYFPMLSSRELRNNFSDRLLYPNHKLLIEEHIYAFVWDPQATTLQKFIGIGQGAMKLAGQFVAFGATLGTNLPSLANSIKDVFSLGCELTQVFKDVKEHATPIVTSAIEAAGTAKAVSGHLRGHRDFETRDMGVYTRYADQDTSLFAFDMARAQRSMPVPVGGESQKEMERDIRSELAERRQRMARLDFMVVQMATPLAIEYEIREMNKSNMICDYMISLAPISVMRIGQTDAYKYSHRISALEQRSRITEELIFPWLVDGTAGYKGLFFDRRVDPDMQNHADERDYQQYVPVVWDTEDPASGWETQKNYPNIAVHLPEHVLLLQERLQRRSQEKNRRFIESGMRGWAHRAQSAVRQREDARREATLAISQIVHLGRVKMPTKEAFVNATSMFMRRRKNPLLFLIDENLESWAEETTAYSLNPDTETSGGWKTRLSTPLRNLRDVCQQYIHEKETKQADPARQSKRLPAVKDLLMTVNSILSRIEDVTIPAA